MREKLMTTEEVAEYLNIKPKTMKDWRSKGTGPGYMKFGRSRSAMIRYRMSDVDQWIKGFEE